MRKHQRYIQGVVVRLTDIPNVGKRVARDLEIIGIKDPEMLKGKDPLDLYERVCTETRVKQDACLLDVFMAVVDYVNGAPARPWWYYTPERKRSYRMLDET